MCAKFSTSAEFGAMVLMITDPGVEMMLGVSNDPQLGPVVISGFNGVYAELLKDSVVLLTPFTEKTARRA